jgi:hypothetical protein
LRRQKTEKPIARFFVHHSARSAQADLSSVFSNPCPLILPRHVVTCASTGAGRLSHFSPGRFLAGIRAASSAARLPRRRIHLPWR